MHTDLLTLMSIGLSRCCLKEVSPYEWKGDWEEFNETYHPKQIFRVI